MKEDALKAALDKLEAEAMALNNNEVFKIEDILNIVSEINKVLNDLVNPKERPEMRAYQRKYTDQFERIQALTAQNFKKHNIDVRGENLAPVMGKAKENSVLFDKYLKLVKLANEERKKLSAPVEGYAKNPKIREAVTNKAKKSDAVAQEAKRMLSYSEIDTLLSQIDVYIKQINTPPHTSSDVSLLQMAKKIKRVNDAVKKIDEEGKKHSFPSEDTLYYKFLEAKIAVLKQQHEILGSAQEIKTEPTEPKQKSIESDPENEIEKKEPPRTRSQQFTSHIALSDSLVPAVSSFHTKKSFGISPESLLKLLSDTQYAEELDSKSKVPRLIDAASTLLEFSYDPPKTIPTNIEKKFMGTFFDQVASYDVPRIYDWGLQILFSQKNSTEFKKIAIRQLVNEVRTNKDEFLKNTKQLLEILEHEPGDDSGISETDIINLRSLALQKPEDFTKFHAACDKLNKNHQHFSKQTTPDDKDKISLAEYATLFKMTKMLPTLEAINKYGGFDNDPEMKKFFEAAKKADTQLKAMGIEYKPSMKAAHFFQKLAKPFIKLQEKISHTAPIAIRTVQYTAGALKNTISSSQPLQFLKQKKEQLFTPKEDKKASQTPNTEPQKPKK